MAFLVWLLFALLALGAGYWGAPFLEQFASFLQDGNFVSKPSPAWGIIASVLSSVLAFAYVKLSQNRSEIGVIRIYRRAEEELVGCGKMEISEVLDYHRSYNWHAYAGLGFSTLFIIVALFIEDKLSARTAIEYFAIIFGFGLLAVATIILGVVDLFHTNTLTPLVTSGVRFKIIDRVILLGGLALALQICAVGVFLSLINTWLSLISSVVTLFLIVFFAGLRGIPVEALASERKLSEEHIELVLRSQER